MAREAKTTYDLCEPPHYLESAYLQRNDEGLVEIGIIKKNGDTIFAYVDWDEFWADVQFLQKAKP